MRWAWHVAHMGERRGAYWNLVGKHEVKRPLGRPRHRQEDNITSSELVSSQAGFCSME
jgi:hypothetical protein